MPPPCSLHPPHPTFSLPSHHSVPPPKQMVQVAPPQPIPSTIKTTFNAQLVALEELSASDIALEWDQFLDERRRLRRSARRKKRKKNLGLLEEEEEMEDDEDENWLFGPDRSMTLTKRQEAALARYLQEEAMLETKYSQMAINSTGNGPSFKSPKRINRQKVQLRARASEERIVMNYKRLVISVASTYEGCGISFDDLVQEGCVGLLRGVRKFDPKKGNKLSTYVYWWIKQAIVRAIANNSRLIRLPVNLCEATSKVMKANSTLASKLGRKPTYAEIAKVVNLSASSVRIIIQRNRKPISLDLPLHKNGVKLKDILSAPDETSPEFLVLRQHKLQSLEDVICKLSHKEESVIRLRYGLNCERAETFEDIGKLLNISGERVRYIHMKAIGKLREEKGLIECLMQCTLLTHVFH